MYMGRIFMTGVAILLFNACGQKKQQTATAVTSAVSTSSYHAATADTGFHSIHVFVALCDNKYQGIVPVPAKIGNGQEPANNLYWGAAAGIRTWFSKSKSWKLQRREKGKFPLLERLVFKHVSKNYFLVADAYDGKEIRKCTEDFLASTAGLAADTISLGNKTIGIGGNSRLLCYIGHNGLMDFGLPATYINTDKKKRDAIILACISKNYFSALLRSANAQPLVWTTGLMCPEAYTLHDALEGYVNAESNEGIRSRAALAYSKYQRCGLKAARNLLVTGW